MFQWRCGAVVFALALFFIACSEDQQNNIKEKSEQIGEKFKDKSDETRDKAADKLEKEIVDYLTCAGVARPSTLMDVAAVLKNKDLIKLNDLLMAPENAAQLVAIAGVTVEGAVLLLQNVRLLTEQGHLKQVLNGQVDELTCGDTVTLACTSGTGSTTVACDANDQITSVTSSYDACFLRGKPYGGQVTTTIDPNDKTKVAFAFNNLTIDEVDVYNGQMTIQVDVGDEGQLFSVDAGGDAFEKQSFGGHMGEFSCGQTLSLETVSVDRKGTGDVAIAFSGSKQTKEDTYTFKSFGEHLKWTADEKCTCPLAGSGFEVSIPKPLGRADETATLRVTFEAGSGTCSSPKVEVLGWPAECSKLTESPFEDCGKASVEKLIAPLLGAMCQPLE